MSYSVLKTNDIYDLHEKNSGTIIQLHETDENRVRSMCRKLNLGSGFNGWTPEFVAKKLLTFQ
jgi:hypothetical protein